VCVIVIQAQHTTAVCWGGGLNKYQGPAGDSFQRPLRSRLTNPSWGTDRSWWTVPRRFAKRLRMTKAARWGTAACSTQC